jgi:hypothetical protein
MEEDYEDLIWIKVAHDRVSWWDLVLAVSNF